MFLFKIIVFEKERECVCVKGMVFFLFFVFRNIVVLELRFFFCVIRRIFIFCRLVCFWFCVLGWGGRFF